MAIHFSGERMEEVLEAHSRWWQGTLDRPLARVVLPDAYRTEKRTPAPILSQQNCHQLEWTAEQVIDAIDESLGWQEYLGDAFPYVIFDAFGPGVLAALCEGAVLDNRSR